MSVSVVSDEKWSQDEKVKNVITCDFPGKFLKNFTLEWSLCPEFGS